MNRNNNQPSFYSVFTKYSLMEDYGFSSGIISRFFRKFLPISPEKNTVEYILLKEKNPLALALDLVNFENPDKSIIETDFTTLFDLIIKLSFT